MSSEALAFLIIFVLLGCVMFAFSITVVRDEILYVPPEIRQAKEQEEAYEKEYAAKTQDLGRLVVSLYQSLENPGGHWEVNDETKTQIKDLTTELEKPFAKKHGAGLPITIATDAFSRVIPYFASIKPDEKFLVTKKKLDSSLRSLLESSAPASPAHEDVHSLPPWQGPPEASFPSASGGSWPDGQSAERERER